MRRAYLCPSALGKDLPIEATYRDYDPISIVPFFVLLTTIAVAIAVLTVAASNRLVITMSNRGPVLAALPLLNAALLAVFVFGEDDYRDNGTSRWEAYRSPGGALGPMFLASVTLLVGAAVLLAYSGLSEHRRLFRATLLVVGLTGLFLVIPTIMGFSVN